MPKTVTVFLILIGIFSAVVVQNYIFERMELSTAGIDTPEKEAKWRADKAAEARKRGNEAAKKEAEAKADEYIATLQSSMKAAQDLTIDRKMNSTAQLLILATIPSAWAEIYEEGARLDLTTEQQALRKKFRAAVVKKQAQIFPILRDRFGAALRSELWESNGYARTFGAGFRTIEVVGVEFASNRNVKKAHETIEPILLQLRFAQSRYKWYREDSQYVAYSVPSAKDTDLAVWGKTYFHLVD